jgi:hypothetical protein
VMWEVSPVASERERPSVGHGPYTALIGGDKRAGHLSDVHTEVIPVALVRA